MKLLTKNLGSAGRGWFASVLAALLVVGTMVGGSARPASAADARTQVIILTDIGQDPDDQQSLIRTLLYSNDISIKGILPTYVPNGPVRPDLVFKTIDAYGKDLASLRRHDSRYPSAELLKGRVRSGLNINHRVGNGYDSAASKHIIYMVDNSDGPVWVLVWGGTRELAQAIHKVKTTRSQAQFIAFQKKLRVYSISLSQYSPEPGQYLLDNAKDMFWIASIEHDGSRSATFRGMYLEGDRSMQNADWLRANILNRGHLGALYPLNTTEKGLKEGDTPSLLHVLPIGLNDPELPKGGGWGGRYTKESDYYGISTNLYTSKYQFDTVGGNSSRRLSVARWRDAYQADFQARARWLEVGFAQANHPPEVKVAGPTLITAKPNQSIALDARGSRDPDGDFLSYRWWVYEEPTGYNGTIRIVNDRSPQATLVTPNVPLENRIHVILEVKDSGSPALTRYHRIMVDVNR
ncbi:nucleoside hydrolase-like domain-containing protein [Geminicoccus roseus]|uniref:nucleoside hydrolase-like domain-containing protein n=1 Tax=Geminicoccus roseus TaxID=404900 RepID=UPI00146FAE1F|nr:nucleoside hydrolase-like domain-containing protein [Geminicoccus roseus]